MLAGWWSGFKNQRPQVRSLIYLIWINVLSTALAGVFVQLYLYQRFTSVELNIIAMMFSYTGIMVGFCVPGYLASIFTWNVRHGFLAGFAVMGFALFYMLQITSVATAYLAMFIWGAGQGIYWLTVNTFELSETEDHERDLYSSYLNAGNQVLGLLGPACAALLIWISQSILHFGTYTLIFTIAPAVYLLGFFCFRTITDYRPPHITLADVKHFFVDRKNQAAQLYTFGTGFQQILGVTIPPLAIFFVLGTALRVGVYNTLFAIFTALCILAIARYRTQSNRLFIYGVTLTGVALVTAWFGTQLTLIALIIYTIIEGVLSPLMGISSHVIDLYVMEIGRTETDFYATMLMRDFFLWIWRIVGGFVFLAVIGSVTDERTMLSLGLYCLAGALILMYLGAYLTVKQPGTTAATPVT